jgi:hypothetical protein
MAPISLALLAPSPKSVALVLFWCNLHDAWDGCYNEFNCPRHPRPLETFHGKDCICSNAMAWDSFPKTTKEQVTCKCDCHARNSQYSGRTCSWCCKKVEPICKCICHTIWHEGCSDYMGVKCCDMARVSGETDLKPRLFESNYGYSGTYNRDKGCMTETIHIHMTIEGGAYAKDLFHLIMHYLDNDYPIKPMRKVGDKLRICNDCNGLVWENCVLTPESVKRAAVQASRYCEEDVTVKLHHWKKGKKCNKGVREAVIEAAREATI